MENLSRIKKILILLGVCAAVFLILDFGYFWQNIKFNFFKPPAHSQSVSPPQKGEAENKIQPDILIIDSLGVKVPVVYVEGDSEKVFQAGLIFGVVHYPGTANPGQPGNCYIFGHSSDFIWSKGHYKNIFALLPRIEKNAEIIVSDHDGNKYIYTVIDSHEVAAGDLSVMDQQNYQKKLLTLQTSYPLGTALARWIVIAEEKP